MDGNMSSKDENYDTSPNDEILSDLQDGSASTLISISSRPRKAPPATNETTERMNKYLQLCQKSTSNTARTQQTKETILAPLFSWEAKTILEKEGFVDRQHALLGSPTDGSSHQPILLNTEHPFSAFICGSQGSGKSYTTCCILEGCLSRNDSIGTLQQPLAGMVFHYDRYGANLCEVASLSTGKAAVKVEVLVSPSNFKAMEEMYSRFMINGGNLKVKPLYLKSSHLNAERIQKFMACEEGTKPLYMSAVDRVLRDMGIVNQGPQVMGNGKEFDYVEFKDKIKTENFTPAQRDPLNLRLSLLESYMAPGTLTSRLSGVLRPHRRVEDSLVGVAGCVKLVDLTDPHLDRAGACALFDLCLAVFVKSTKVPKIIALDEAHNYISESTSSAEFTEDLLKVVREQRHNGSRVIIATQEPTISTKFLDLCSMSIVHRFTSPDWFRTLRGHLGGASRESGMSDDMAKQLFGEIGSLDVGESFVFSPTALVDVKDGVVQKLRFGRKKMMTRLRISDDAGKSKLAQDS